MLHKQLILSAIITALALLVLALAPKQGAMEGENVQAWPTGIENATLISLSDLLPPPAAPTIGVQATTP